MTAILEITVAKCIIWLEMPHMVIIKYHKTSTQFVKLFLRYKLFREKTKWRKAPYPEYQGEYQGGAL